MKEKLINIFRIKFTKANIAMIAFACIINVGLFLAMYYTGVPLVLDTVGTAYIAYLLGPTAGIIASVITFFVQFIFYKMSAFVNLAIALTIALIVGISSRKKDYKNFLAVLGTAFLSFLFGTLITSIMPLIGINVENNSIYLSMFYNNILDVISNNAGKTDAIKYVAMLSASAMVRMADCLATMVLSVVIYYLTPSKIRYEMLDHHLDQKEDNND